MSFIDLLVLIAFCWLVVKLVKRAIEQRAPSKPPTASSLAAQTHGLPPLDYLRPGIAFTVPRAQNPAAADAWAEEARRRGLDVRWVDRGTPLVDGWRVQLPPAPPPQDPR